MYVDRRILFLKTFTPGSARQAHGNLLAVIASAGLGRQSILKVTAYIVGVAHWLAFDAAYAELMGECRPARSVVPVPELHFGYLIKVDAIAAEPRPKGMS